jgi:hypothetical protein
LHRDAAQARPGQIAFRIDADPSRIAPHRLAERFNERTVRINSEGEYAILSRWRVEAANRSVIEMNRVTPHSIAAVERGLHINER